MDKKPPPKQYTRLLQQILNDLHEQRPGYDRCSIVFYTTDRVSDTTDTLAEAGTARITSLLVVSRLISVREQGRPERICCGEPPVRSAAQHPAEHAETGSRQCGEQKTCRGK